MNRSRSRAFWGITASAVIVLLGVSVIAKGMWGGIAYVLSITATSAHLLSLKALLKLGTTTFADSSSRFKVTWGTVFVVFASLATLPILVAAGYYVQNNQAVAMPCFLWGIGLVYFVLVGWATIQG